MSTRFEGTGAYDDRSGEEMAAEMKLTGYGLNARGSSAAVNRTHRVVRERAKSMQAQKNRVRSLWIPLTVSFGFLALLLCSLWSLLDESEFFPNGMPDSSQQMMILMMWCLPLSGVLLAVVWFRRGGTRTTHGGPR